MEFFELVSELNDETLYQMPKPEGPMYQNTQKVDESYFRMPDLEDMSYQMPKQKETIEDTQNYLLTIVSGEELGFECELGTLCSGGSMIVSLNELKQMVEEGTYNIIQAEYFNPNMIAIKYQQYIPREMSK